MDSIMEECRTVSNFLTFNQLNKGHLSHLQDHNFLEKVKEQVSKKDKEQDFNREDKLSKMLLMIVMSLP